MIRQRFADNMRLLRQKKRLTQAELATLTDISRTAIYSYEKGISAPPVDIAYRIARVLGTRLSDMLEKDAQVIVDTQFLGKRPTSS